jgi:uncharacterized integral membrane protein
MKIQWSLIFALIFALITAIFAVMNVNPVNVNLFFGTVSLPLILLILGCTLLGGIIVGSFGIYWGYRLQKEVKLLKSQLVHIQEVTGYTLPVQEETPSTEQEPKDDQPVQ